MGFVQKIKRGLIVDGEGQAGKEKKDRTKPQREEMRVRNEKSA